MVEINPVAAAPEKRPDRNEIDAKPKAAAKAERSEPIQSKPAEAAKAEPPAKIIDAEPAKPLDETAEEKLRHALETLPKLSSIEEIRGARQSLKAELGPDQFAVWNAESYSREKQLQGRR